MTSGVGGAQRLCLGGEYLEIRAFPDRGGGKGGKKGETAFGISSLTKMEGGWHNVSHKQSEIK